MKSNKILLMASLLLMAMVMPVNAQYHQIGAYANGGYASQCSSSEYVLPGRGFNTTVGFAYEMQSGHFIFDTGVGLHWQSAGVHVADDSFVYPTADGEYLIDTQGEPFKMNVIVEDRMDFTRMGYAQVPVLVGGIFGHLYFLGGVKLNVPMFGVTRMKGTFTTQGLYDRYNQPVTSASFHGFFNDYPSSIRGPKLQMLPVDLMGTFELGYNFSITEDMISVGERVVRETRLRLALYADYSLIPLHQNATLIPITVNENHPYDIDRFTPAHVLNTDRTLNTYLANFNVGVKFTVLFGNKQRFICRSCESAVEAGINSPNSGYRSRDNRRTDTRHPDTTPDVQK